MTSRGYKKLVNVYNYMLDCSAAAGTLGMYDLKSSYDRARVEVLQPVWADEDERRKRERRERWSMAA
jgi:hypothetical protein